MSTNSLNNESYNDQTLRDFLVLSDENSTRTLTVKNTSNTANSSAAHTMSVPSGSTGDPYVVYEIGAANRYTIGIDRDRDDSLIITGSTSPAASTRDKCIISADGSVQFPNTTLFRAYLSSKANGVTGDGTNYTIAFDTENYDEDNNFSTSTNTFTAPLDGKYLIYSHVTLVDASAGFDVASGELKLESSNLQDCYYTCGWGFIADANTKISANVYKILNLSANDTVTIQVQISGSSFGDVASVEGGTDTTFVGGFLIQ